MPIIPNGGLTPESWRGQFTDVNGIAYSIEALYGFQSEAEFDASIQSFLNHMNKWPDLESHAITKKSSQGYNVTPDPEPEP